MPWLGIKRLRISLYFLLKVKTLFDRLIQSSIFRRGRDRIKTTTTTKKKKKNTFHKTQLREEQNANDEFTSRIQFQARLKKAQIEPVFLNQPPSIVVLRRDLICCLSVRPNSRNSSLV